MVKSLEVEPGKLIIKLSEKLKKEPEIKAPEWAAFVKTGRHRERPPTNDDWWEVRAASMLRAVAKNGPVGVSKMRLKYGGKPNRGHKPGRFRKGSGSIARKVLQQLEKADLVKQTSKGVHKGRIITEKAAALLNSTAIELGATPLKKRKKNVKAQASKQKEKAK